MKSANCRIRTHCKLETKHPLHLSVRTAPTVQCIVWASVHVILRKRRISNFHRFPERILRIFNYSGHRQGMSGNRWKINSVRPTRGVRRATGMSLQRNGARMKINRTNLHSNNRRRWCKRSTLFFISPPPPFKVTPARRLATIWASLPCLFLALSLSPSPSLVSLVA